MLYNQSVWSKYAKRDQTRAKGWAPMPEAQKMTTIIPAADQQSASWQYTTSAPGGDWFKPGFDSAQWKEGKGGFGTRGTPGAVIGTVWNTREIWLRREVELSPEKCRDPQAWLHHDEDVEVYINGVLALKSSGWISDYESFPLTNAARNAIKPGKNLIAIHCRQTTGGQYIDLGLVSGAN
jgi:hypothetical protein